jgi:hypothetical protein
MIWQRQSAVFRKFWSEQVLTQGHEEIPDDTCDEIIRILDYHAKGKPKGSEVVAKLTFYLEALDRDVKKPHERPSIGVLLCASKDTEVVKYALSRVLSPALIAECQTRLPDRKLLQRKLHEFYQLAMPKTK